MRRKDVIKQLRKIAKAKGCDLQFVEGGPHTKAMFDGHLATTIPRHNEINELTAKGLLRDAESWQQQPDNADDDDNDDDAKEHEHAEEIPGDR